MTIAELIKRLAEPPYEKDFRIERHTMEVEACVEAKKELAKKVGDHNASHMLADMDTMLHIIKEHGLPTDLDDALNNYELNGATKRGVHHDDAKPVEGHVLSDDELDALLGG